MSAQPAPSRHLHLVDETGEVVPSSKLADMQAELEKLRGDFANAEKDLKVKRRQIAELQRDKARERMEHPQRDLVVRVLRYWHRRCRGGSARVNPLSADRFDAVAALAEMEQLVVEEGKRKRRRDWLYEFEHFKAAIDGCAFEHYSVKRKNGTEQHFDDAELIFRSASKMDEFIQRCPYPVVPILPARRRPGVSVSFDEAARECAPLTGIGVAPSRFTSGRRA